jgi:nicotinamide-nucleotide amidase
MWPAALEAQALRDAIAGAGRFTVRTLRMYGMPESEIAETLRVAERQGVALDTLEITTCLRRGEIEVVTRYEDDAREAYEALEEIVRERHAATLFSDDGSTIDELVARALLDQGATIATAESCTGGLLAARLTERAGSSAYVLGGVVAYANSAKVHLVGVDPELITRHGAVSLEVAEALAFGALRRFDADVGVGITGVAGPGGGTEAKPVGFVCLSVAERDGRRITRAVQLPGGRADIRDRSTTVAMHLLRRLLHGEGERAAVAAA